MKNFGTVKSTVRPEPLVVDEFSAWRADNIQEVSENLGTENEFVGFSYELIQYSKDEYIRMLSEKNLSLESQLTDTQIALTEIYESMGV